MASSGVGSSRKVPLRLVLIVPFVLEIIAAVGLTGWFSLRNGQKAVNELATQLQSEVSTRIHQHLDSYLAIPKQINQTNTEAIRLGLLDITNPTQLGRTFWQQIQTFESISYISFGSEQNGGFVDAGRQSDGTFVIEVTENFVAGDFLIYATDDQANRTELLSRSPDYDPRLRPWYTDAIGKSTTTWSEPYSMFPDLILAITAITPIYRGDRQLQGVLATDVTLAGINEFLQTLQIGQSGQAFIVERSGLLIGTSTDQLPFVQAKQGQEPERLSAADINVPLIQTTTQELIKRFGGFQQIQQNQNLTLNFEGTRQFVQVVPFRDEMGLDWLIVVAVPESDFMAQISTNTRNTILLCLAAAILAIWLGILTSRWIAYPLTRLTEASRAFTNGELDHSLENSQIREFSILAESFDAMRRQLQQSFAALANTNAQLEERVEERTNELTQTLINLQRTQAQLIQTEKMSSLGQMVAGVAHEINNPISFIHDNLGHAADYSQQLLALVELYQQQYPLATPTIQAAIETIDFPFVKHDLPRLLSSMSTGTERISEIIKSLRNFARLDEAAFKDADLHEGINSTLMILQKRFKRMPAYADIQLKKDYGELPLIECYPGQLNQVFMNLLTNALDAVDERDAMRSPDAIQAEPGYVWISTEADPDGWVMIRVQDNGAGMSEKTRSRLFDPFFTTKAIGKGTGLGLAIAYQIVVDRHGGHIECQSTQGKGTEFIVKIPVRQTFATNA
ncbi:ATP-binding protein [Leptolyngbya sp. AN02str]|uniref:ATP-binding protein n=1 Tax=Leptolyngbya sp. AN02str TaxID=3423363 RepID=UPI003D314CA1